jgi:hypothetical protein
MDVFICKVVKKIKRWYGALVPRPKFAYFIAIFLILRIMNKIIGRINRKITAPVAANNTPIPVGRIAPNV